MKNQLRLYASIMMVLASVSASLGKAVDENTAKTVGANYLISVGVHGVRTASDLSATYIASSVINGKTVNEYYVFNVTNANGFVMVAADDNVIPILAYSNTAAFSLGQISPAAADWIDGYKNQIATVIGHEVPAKPQTIQNWNDLRNYKPNPDAKTTSVSPLCVTTWNQDPYYDNLCPGSGSTKAVTGCVATAMSQVMKFWNWPTVGCGYHDYNCAIYGNLFADFGNTAYQWTSMPNSITSNNVPIGTLMFHAGVSVNMVYNTAASGGSDSYCNIVYSPIVNCAEYALKTYFHYKKTIHSAIRFGIYSGGTAYLDSIPEASWIAMLQTELNAGRPMIYSGQGSSGGHAWVCDGWQVSGNKFHFNWGWGGTGPDGYYTVDNLAPPALGTGGGGGNFNLDQAVIMGIQPDTFPTNTGSIQLLAHLNCTTSSPMKYASPFTITTKILNAGTSTFSGDFCAQVFDTSNNLVGTIQTSSGNTITANDSSAVLNFATTGMYAMIPELYSIKVMYRSTGTTAWMPVAGNNTFINYTIMDVKNDTDIALYNNISVTTGLPVVSTHAVNVNVQVFNRGSGSFHGSFKADLINVATGTVYNVGLFTGQTLASGYYNTFNFNNGAIAAPAGTYALEIEHQYNGTGSFYTTSNLYYENAILVQVVAPSGIGNTTPPANEVLIYPNPSKDFMHILFNGVAVTGITVTDMQGREIQKLEVDGNQTSSVLPLGNYAAGMYLVQLQTATGAVTKKITVTK